MQSQTEAIHTLSQIGLTTSEARLYLLLLELGPVSIAALAKQLETSRQAVYVTVPSLIEHGLIKQVQYGKRALYQAMSPGQLKVLAQETSDQVERLIPELAKVQSGQSSLPLVTVYENPLSMREWYELLLKSAKKGDELLICSTGDIGNWYSLDQRYYQKFLERVKTKGIKQRVLLPHTEESGIHLLNLGWSVEEYRYTPKNLSTKVEQYVWHDQVCYLSMGGVATSLISLQSTSLAEYSRNLFESIWEVAGLV